MQGTFITRFRTAATLLTLAAAMLATKPAVLAAWNHPGVLLLRSQVQLMRGDAQDAVTLAHQATEAARKRVESPATRI